jgi:hypothetical protein
MCLEEFSENLSNVYRIVAIEFADSWQRLARYLILLTLRCLGDSRRHGCLAAFATFQTEDQNKKKVLA